MNINDWSSIVSLFDKLNKQLEKTQKVTQSPATPRVYIRILVELEDFIAKTFGDREARKKMSPTNAKAFNSMRQRLKKHNVLYQEQIDAFRANPETTEEVGFCFASEVLHRVELDGKATTRACWAVPPCRGKYPCPWHKTAGGDAAYKFVACWVLAAGPDRRRQPPSASCWARDAALMQAESCDREGVRPRSVALSHRAHQPSPFFLALLQRILAGGGRGGGGGLRPGGGAQAEGG